MRKITYSEAIREATEQLMKESQNVFLIGQGVTSPWYVGSTTEDLADQFGKERVIDTPISENAITGSAVGAAMAGMRPIVVHPRMDFMFYAMDPLLNQAGPWFYMFGGKVNVPVTVRAIINRGGAQAAQHSQAAQALFAHVPGIKVVMPSTPYDAKGLLVAAVKDDNPVVFIDDRWCYDLEEDVPEEIYSVPIGQAAVRRSGKSLTIATISYITSEVLKAAEELADEGIDIEVIDLRSVKPLDKEILFQSIKKTGRLLVVEATWPTCGLAAEVSALAAENVFSYLKAPIERLSLPDVPAPASVALEKGFYLDRNKIILKIREMMKDK